MKFVKIALKIFKIAKKTLNITAIFTQKENILIVNKIWELSVKSYSCVQNLCKVIKYMKCFYNLNNVLNTFASQRLVFEEKN